MPHTEVVKGIGPLQSLRVNLLKGRSTPPCWAAQRRLPGRNRVTERVGAGSFVQPAIVRAQIRAFSLSAMPGNRRRNSITADSSPSRS
jgi:hypothetical protein